MDIIAGLLELLANWLIGNKKRAAFIVFNIANCFWIWTAFEKHVYGLLLICLPAIVINIRNFIKWGAK